LIKNDNFLENYGQKSAKYRPETGRSKPVFGRAKNRRDLGIPALPELGRAILRAKRGRKENDNQ